MTGFKQETANLQFAIATVNRVHPAFLVMTGDLINPVLRKRRFGRF
jgi:hypothetical protein